MGEWKEYKLSDIATEIGDGLHGTPKYSIDGNCYFINGNNIVNGKVIIKDDTKRISDIEFDLYKKPLFDRTVLLSINGTIGNVGLYNGEKCILGKSVCYLNIKNSVDKRFIYYTFLSNSFQTHLRNIATGTTILNVPLKSLRETVILLPSLDEQKRIASILSSLDDKIDLLYRENKTLEAMAEVLFNRTLSDKENNGTIEQFVSIQNGYAFKSKDFQEHGINGVIKIKNISGGVIDINKTDCIGSNIIQGISSKFKVHSGDILIAMTGAEIGKLGIIPSTNKNLWLNQRVGMLVERYPGAKYIAYLQLKSDYGLDYVKNTSTGSAQPNISSSAIENCGFPLLDVSEIKVLAYQLEGLYEKIIHNLGHINGLKLLKNELLLKLMNSQV